jgi:hypothetical protein
MRAHSTSRIPSATLDPVKTWVKHQEGFRWLEIETGHDAMITAPDRLARILIEVAEA